MTEDEFIRWQNVIHDAIAGEWVTILCRDARACKNDFKDCLAVCDLLGVAYEARSAVGNQSIVIGDDIMDGGIDFRTPYMEHRRCGDPRDAW